MRHPVPGTWWTLLCPTFPVPLATFHRLFSVPGVAPQGLSLAFCTMGTETGSTELGAGPGCVHSGSEPQASSRSGPGSASNRPRFLCHQVVTETWLGRVLGHPIPVPPTALQKQVKPSWEGPQEVVNTRRSRWRPPYLLLLAVLDANVCGHVSPRHHLPLHCLREPSTPTIKLIQ